MAPERKKEDSKAAVRALPRIVARGDPGAIAAVAELVGHAEKNVRSSLSIIEPRGKGVGRGEDEVPERGPLPHGSTHVGRHFFRICN